ncbi:MAG: NACHT domain-containing protein [Solirubrobacterales bacterium]
MDPVLGQVIYGVISNAIYSVIERSWSDATATTLDSAVTAACADLSSFEEVDDEIGDGPLERFLSSPEAFASVRQLFVSTVHGSEATTKEIRSEFARSFVRAFPHAAEESADRLFDALARIVEEALSVAAREGNAGADEAIAAARFRRLDEELAGLRSTLEELRGVDEEDVEAIAEWERLYRNAVKARHGTITPPSLDASDQVPVDDIFVEPTFASLDSEAPKLQISYAALSDRLDRTVVLGDPGAGKSTYALKLAYDLARERATVPGGHLTPFIVNLKDYGAEKDKAPLSIVDWIEAIANSDYQTPPPPGAVAYLLAAGRAAVIFDGLDELLDTSHRRIITSDIETFAARFVAAPILVTSRRVGYPQAPLDPRRFSMFRLNELDEKQIERYVKVWFGLRVELTRRVQEQMAGDFLSDSKGTAEDLRTNTLMLGLLCNLYRGDGYIPRHRPQVYEKCAVMLFERWDKGRRIHVQLEFERHLRPAMQHLAFWIYSNPALRGGVTERDLVTSATEFLQDRRFDDPDDARAEACRFVEFCSGRAWVFTDTGTTPGGERLYQFTHRTFLEFFAAEHLVRTCRTPDDLAKVLRPHIAAGEWDVVAQLAYQLQDDNIDGAADELLSDLLREANGEQRDVLLNFAARSLAFLVPRRDVCREVTRAVTQRTFEWLLEGSAPGDDSDLPRESHAALTTVDRENFDPVSETLYDEALKFLREETDAERADAALEVAVHARMGLTGIKGARQRWEDNEVRVFEEMWPLLEPHAKAKETIAFDGFMFGRLEPRDVATLHGPGAFFDGPSYRLYGAYVRPALSQVMLGGLAAGRLKLNREPLGTTEELEQIAAALGGADTPWEDRSGVHVGTWLFLQNAPKGHTDPELEGKAFFGAFCLIAAMVERTQVSDEVEQMLAELNSRKGWIEALQPWIRQRLGKAEQHPEIGALPLTKADAERVAAWSENEWSATSGPLSPRRTGD